ncbi:STP1 protein [Plasmodium ovale wallikeri]|uniref:STP1 protein n=1 Tax=Plasmodium ovale wallikeri TaxID=864142 RepID=A0A1A9AJC0_PLAOA|nr:STP1 protein [Plasmodium ovale wallikeri]
MAQDAEYTILTRYIHIDVFLNWIESDIKKFIHTYGHKKCGLMHVELCEEIKKIINERKTLILKPMDEKGKQKWNSEWRKKKNGFLKKLFKEEGFIYTCDSNKNANNPSLNQLLSKHIDFCKKKDARRAAVVAKPKYSECVQYNSWIETQKKSFQQEYLNNVRDFKRPNVHKYFSTKEHPGGHDPLATYFKSKLDCDIYNPASKKYQKELVEKAPTNRLQSPGASSIKKESHAKDERSVTDGDSASEKKEINEKKSLQTELHTPKSQITSPPNTQLDGTNSDKNTHERTKAPASADGKSGGNTEATSIKSESPTNGPPTAQNEVPPQAGSPPPPLKDARLTPATQSVSAPKATISLSSSHSTVQDTTSSKTPVTSANTHSAKTLPEPSAAVPSLAQTQPSASDTPPAIIASQEPGTPASSSASTFTTPITTTTMSPAAVASLTMSTLQVPIPSTDQVPSVPGSQEPPPPSASGESKAKEPITVAQAPTAHNGSDTRGLLDPTQPDSADGNEIITLPKNIPQQSKDSAPVSSTTLPEGAQPSGKPSITSTKFPPLTTIIPTIIIILAAITLLFQLYKYTSFGFLLGRRKKRKKQDLKRILEISEKPTYKSPNIAAHELEDPNLVEQTVENDVYIKLLKINRYKQEMQKRKKENKKILIEVHMEVFEEYKNDEWELHKGDFLEICLRGFINEENETYQNFPNSKLTINNINEKTIEDIQKQEILWNNWIEDHRNILEQWKLSRTHKMYIIIIEFRKYIRSKKCSIYLQ